MTVIIIKRNFKIAQGEAFNSSHILQSALCWVSSIGHRLEISAGSITRKGRDQVWTPPPSGCIKLNMDGARDPISGFASVVIVARDEFGTRCGGVRRNIDRCSVVQTKLWAIYDRLFTRGMLIGLILLSKQITLKLWKPV